MTKFASGSSSASFSSMCVGAEEHDEIARSFFLSSRADVEHTL